MDCGAKFLKTTADCTDGKCMPCYTGEPRKDQTGLSSGINERGTDEKMTAGTWSVEGRGVCFMLALYPIIGIVAALIARFGFNASLNTACTIGGGTFIVLGVLGSLGGISRGTADRKSAKTRNAFSKKWTEKHGTKDDEWL